MMAFRQAKTWPRRTRGSAFTLVEVLVVISIIAILAGIVLAMLRGGPESRRVACRNHLRQIYAGLFSYSQSYGQRFPGQWRGDVLIGGSALYKPFQVITPPIAFDFDNVRGDDDLSPLFSRNYVPDIRVFNCPSTTDRADPDRRDEGGNELPEGYDIMWKATEARWTNATEWRYRTGTGERGQLSYEYLGEIAPGIFRGVVNAKLAWVAHDIDDRDLEAGKLDWEIDGDNHGTTGGNILFLDGRAVWQKAEGWTNVIRAGHDERLMYIDVDAKVPTVPEDAEPGEWDRELGWPNKAMDIDQLRTRKLAY